jgi:formylglycine-generating enzyme required for sulfatase activity
MTTLRGLDPHQLEELSRKQRNAEIPLAWLGLTDRPLSRYLRNPFLATRIASLLHRQPSFSIMDSSLAGILDGGVKPEEEVDPYLWFDWLPQIALDIKLRGICKDELVIPERILAAQQMGLLREAASLKPVQFQHSLILDFFAARGLRNRVAREGVAICLSQLLPTDPQFRQQWTDVLVILAGLLDPPSLNELVDSLNAIDPLLAHAALFGLKPADTALAPSLAARTSSRLLEDVANDPKPESRASSLRALGCLDPRVGLAVAVRNLVEIIPRKLWMSRYPVTNMEYAAYLRTISSTSYPPGWLDSAINSPNYPVVGVSFYEATKYATWLNSALKSTSDGLLFCLPTAEEWDRAAHCDRTPSVIAIRTKLVDLASLLAEGVEEFKAEEWQLAVESLVNAIKQRTKALTAQSGSSAEEAAMVPAPERVPVGTFPPNEFDIYDLFGQVWQWCDSWLPLMPGRPSISPDRTGIPVIVKGGPNGRPAAWTMIGGWLDPSACVDNVGFRLCARRN